MPSLFFCYSFPNVDILSLTGSVLMMIYLFFLKNQNIWGRGKKKIEILKFSSLPFFLTLIYAQIFIVFHFNMNFWCQWILAWFSNQGFSLWSVPGRFWHMNHLSKKETQKKYVCMLGGSFIFGKDITAPVSLLI